MSSTNKTSLGLNMWEASDKPVRQDFVNDNVIIDDEVTKLKQDIGSNNTVINEKITKLNSNLENVSNELNEKTNNSNYPLVNRGQITGDLNRLDITPGYYRIEASTSITNGPGSSYCVFVAFGSPFFVQLIADSSGVKCRKRTGNPPTWSGWG
jgi:hypothetical protein